MSITLHDSGRRRALGVIGAAAGAAIAAACGGGSSPTSPSSTATGSSTSTSGSTGSSGTISTTGACVVTPSETAGPYPSRGDFVRSDIRENRQGTPLTVTIKVVTVANACAPLANAEVEIWHCDVAGDYSQYGSQTAATFLRGIQTTNSGGEVTFTTVYPGWYQGRATHIHAEVTSAGRVVKTTQMGFPDAVNNTVHTSGVYASRGTNPTTNARDGILADSLDAEIVTPVGGPSSGYAVNFQIGV